jgi:hypothetical protein
LVSPVWNPTGKPLENIVSLSLLVLNMPWRRRDRGREEEEEGWRERRREGK